jgi:hypothetical protein
MLSANQLHTEVTRGSVVTQAAAGDPALGDLAQLSGIWKNADNLVGHG